MYQPDFEPMGIAEGDYTFTVKGQPELNRRHGKKREFVSPTYEFVAEDAEGNTYRHKESFLPWEDRYRDLLVAFGGIPDEKGRIHGSDLDPSGKSFDASIIRVQDENDPDKTWARLTNIRPRGREDGRLPGDPPDDEEDVPF